MLDHFDAVQIGLTATPLVGRLARGLRTRTTSRSGPRHAHASSRSSEPTFRYTLKEAIDDGLSRSLPDLPRADRQDRGQRRLRGPARGDRLGGARPSCTRGRAGGGCSAASDDDHGRSRRAGAHASPSPSAIGRWCASSARCWRRAIPGSDGVRRAPRLGQDDRLRRHASGTPRRWRGCSTTRSPTRSLHPTTRYADFVVSGMGGQDTFDPQPSSTASASRKFSADPRLSGYAGYWFQLERDSSTW